MRHLHRGHFLWPETVKPYARSIKRLWGFTKVRYRGLDKNAGRAFGALALANLYLARQPLLGQVHR